MIQVKMVQAIEPVEGAKGIYHKITWEDGKSDFIFSPDLLKVMEKAKAGKHAVEVTKEQKGKYWNIVEAKIVTTEDLPPPKEPVRKYSEPPPDAPEPQRKPVEASSKAIIPDKRSQEIETNMWWKIVSDSLGNGVIDRKTPIGKTIERVFKVKMLEVLGIKVETKQTESNQPEAED